MNPKTYRPGLDILKGIAIVFVILIHITGTSFSFYPQRLLTFNILVILDALYRISVPAFVFVSGYTLALSYLTRNISWKDFYLRRVWKILPLYIIWSALILLARRYFLGEISPTWQLDPFWSILMWGKADYHLYFVPMIFQFYLLFPVFFMLVKKFSKPMIILAIIWQLGAYLFIKSHTEIHMWNNVISDQDQYIFFGTWAFYFIVGLFLAINGNVINLLKNKLKLELILKLIVGVFFLWAVWDTFNILRSGFDLLIATRFTKISTLFFAGSTFLLLAITNFSFKLFPEIVKRFLVVLGKRSYLIYLFHTLVIREIYLYIKPDSEVKFITLCLLVIASSLVLAQLFHQIPKLTNLKR